MRAVPHVNATVMTAGTEKQKASGAASFMEPIAARCPMVGLRGTTQRGLQGAAMLAALGL